MKSEIVTAGVLLVLVAMCFAAPRQDTLLYAEGSFKNLARMKRGLLSAIKDTVTNEIVSDDAKLAEFKREKRQCFCGPLRCSCDLSSGEEGGRTITATYSSSKSSSSSSFSASSSSSSSSSSGSITYSG